MTVWNTDGKYLFLSRYLRINQHKRVIAGENFAPDQYRFGSYYLVEYLFKYIAIPWLDENSAEISSMMLSSESWNDEKRSMIDAYLPPADRSRIVADIDRAISEAIAGISPSPLLQNALKAMVGGLNWQTYITEPASTLLLLGENLPQDIRVAVDLASDENRLLNGHLTARFFFNILTLLLLYAFTRQFLSPGISLVSILLFQSIMPLTTMYFGWETFHAAALFLAGLLLIVRKRGYFQLCLLVLLGSTFRADHMVFLSLIFLTFFYGRRLSSAAKFVVLAKTAILFTIPIGFTLISSRLLFPEAVYSVNLFQWDYNAGYIWSWIYPLIFLSLPVIFSKDILRIEFFRKTWIWAIPFLLMNYVVARPAELRLFTPLFLYSLPFVVSGLSRFFQTAASVEDNV
jgi:hypothetical protein